MSKYDKAPSKPKVLIPEGKYPALLYLAADLGHHHDTYEGKDTVKHLIYLSWELVGTKMEDGRPFVIGNNYTVSASRFGGWYLSKTSNCYKMMKAWLDTNNPQDTKKVFTDILEDRYPCVIDVEQKKRRSDPSKVDNVIASVKPYGGKALLELSNTPVDAITFFRKNYELLPDWMKRKIDSSLEATGEVIPAPQWGDGKDGAKSDQFQYNGEDIEDQDVPF
jgi:hypothetical protein